MSKNKAKKTPRSRISKRVILQYFLVDALFVLGLGCVVLAANWLCNQFIWYPDEDLYRILKSIKDNLGWIFALIILVGWSFITYFFLVKPLSYIDEIVVSAKKLATNKNDEVTLNKALYEIQLELDSTRRQALRNEEIAREADKRKNDLIMYLAHDLKTPLTSVIGYLTLLKAEPEISPETRAKYTGIALEKAERLEQLINEFFDITRFSLTTLALEPERINLSRMLEQTMNEFLPIFAEKNLSSRVEIQPNVELLCDPDKLERVFDNLVRNAVNYSYPNSEISLGMISDGNAATVILRNRGKTIPKEKLDRIFEQFFRMDNARQSDTGGAGLGLAIAKEIVTLHDGTISAQSENESIVFRVVLPIK